MKKKRIAVLTLFVLSLAVFGASKLYHTINKDDSLPEIECPTSPLMLSVEENSSRYMLSGVTAWDEKDGDLTSKVLIQGISKTLEEGSLTITYAVVDSDNHVATCTRPAQYTDYKKPRFALSDELYFRYGATTQLGDRVTATDLLDGDISERVRVTGLSDYGYSGYEGLFPVTFEVTNSLGDTSSITLNVELASYTSRTSRIPLKEYLVYLTSEDTFDAVSYLDTDGTFFLSMTGGASSSTLDEAIDDFIDNLDVETELDLAVPGIYAVRYSYTRPKKSTETTTNTEPDEEDAAATLYVVVE